jgi:hypothetical protein
MGSELELDGYLQCRMEHLERNYRRTRFILADAKAQYRYLSHTPGIPESRLAESRLRVMRARDQLEDILSAIEFIEDQSYSALTVQRVGLTESV